MNTTVKVRHIINLKGNKVPNQFIIEKRNKESGYRSETFQSYDSTIAKRVLTRDGTLTTYLDPYYWKYSITTSRYRNIFLNESTKETQAKIDSGEYKLLNMNG